MGKGRNTFSSAYLHCSTSSHGERERRGMGLMAIVGPQAVRLDDRQSPGSCCACAATEARLSSLVKGARAGFEKPGEPWPHRLLTPSLQSSLCPTVLVTLRGGRYICREPPLVFYCCISNPQHPGSSTPNAFLYTHFALLHLPAQASILALRHATPRQYLLHLTRSLCTLLECSHTSYSREFELIDKTPQQQTQ